MATNQSGDQRHIIKNSDLLDISETKLSEISEPNENQPDLDNLDDLMKVDVEKHTKVFLYNQSYNFTNQEERVDVYIKNYLSKFEMNKTLKTFEQELYEQLSKNQIRLEDLPNVPQIYIESEKLQEEIGNIQKELDDAKIYAEKANSMFIKLNSQKESEKIKHRRVQQEKKKLIKEMEDLKEQYIEDNKIYKELKKKYWEVTNLGLLLENDQAKAKATFSALKEQSDKLKKAMEEMQKHREASKENNYNLKKIQKKIQRRLRK